MIGGHGAQEPVHLDLASLLVRSKHEAGLSISVCLPARDEAATIGPIVETVVRELVEGIPLVDEVLVMDDGSTDATAAVAAAAGARVVAAASVLPQFGPTLGKGDVLWRSLAACSGDLVVWCDADLTSFGAHYVTGLLAPLLAGPVALVKASYLRPSGGGGRVTELVARPLLHLLRPDLAHILQPLGGEYAVRRTVAERHRFEVDYGVEIGLLLDIADDIGPQAIAQVDLGVRHHRSRPLEELRGQALSVTSAVLHRCAVPLGGGSPAWHAGAHRVLRPSLRDVLDTRPAPRRQQVA